MVQAKNAVSEQPTNALALPLPKVLETPVDSVPAVWSAVSTTSLLQKPGESPEYAIKAECPNCQANFKDAEAQKLQVRCPTDGCGNSVFLVEVQAESERHWLRIVERLGHTASGVIERAIPAAQPEAEIKRKQPWWVWSVVALGVVILFFLVRYWYWGLPIPLVHKPQEYQFELAPNEEIGGAQ